MQDDRRKTAEEYRRDVEREATRDAFPARSPVDDAPGRDKKPPAGNEEENPLQR